MDLNISVENRGTYQLVRLEGELNVETSRALEEQIAELASGGADNFLLDLSELSSIDSRGAGMLVHVHYYGKIVFAALQPSVREVLERLMLMEKLKICRKVGEAEKRITSGA